MNVEEFTELDVDQFEGRQSPGAESAATILLTNGDGVAIRNSKARAGTGTFVTLENVKGEGFFADNDVRKAKQVFGSGKNGFVQFGNALPGKTVDSR